MYQYPADANGVGRLDNTPCAVTHERPAEPTTLMGLIDGQSRKHDDRDWVGHIAPEASRSRSDVHRTGGQGIIANDFVRIAYDKGSRGAAA
jgi:hypothetical protein